VLGADSWKEDRAMATENADDLVPFLNVTVIRSTAPRQALVGRRSRQALHPALGGS
jgi:hypothetical protein